MVEAGWFQRGRTELFNLLRPNASDRPWELALCAALASGLPLLVGAYLGQLGQGLVASLGGMVFLYCPNTPVHHRAVTLMACAFGLMASYALGLLGHLLPWLLVPLLTLSCMLVTMIVRFYALGPPGSLFFVMATAIAAYTPTPPAMLLERVGLIALGCLQAVLIAFLYSLYIVRRRVPKPAAPLSAPSFDFIVLDSVVIALFVGGALLLAQLLQLDRPYWAPISCLAVIQGPSLRAVWTRQAHRITGTAVGLLLAGAVLALPLGAWGVACVMTSLAFVIELLVVRHYGLAVVFITPLTLLLAEAAQLGQVPIADLLEARLVDTVLGSLTGLVGGFCLHHPGFRRGLGIWLRRWGPQRQRDSAAD
jgi:uncharacterized membrane protein YccC